MYSFSFKPYQRRFFRPLRTHYGLWEVREGIIIHLQDEQGREGWGEIAPLPWFGSETLDNALNYCQKLDKSLTKDQIFSIPDYLPACQFGFESALTCWETPFKDPKNYCYLLPTGKEALKQWKILYSQAKKITENITFKWKIGVDSPEIELNLWKQLMIAFPDSIKLRLDANGGLTLKEAKTWLRELDQDQRIEFLEQPLPVSEFESMLRLSENHITPLALDESVSSLQQLEQCYWQGWRGIFVIKAAIMGYPFRLRRILKDYSLDCVFSSVFETEIGRKSVLKLAQELSNSQRALGLGVNHWFVN